MSDKKVPSKSFLRDLKTLFDKHGWGEGAIGIRTLEGSAQCIPPQEPHEVTYQDAAGNLHTRIVCL
jgi:hypothetical protein